MNVLLAKLVFAFGTGMGIAQAHKIVRLKIILGALLLLCTDQNSFARRENPKELRRQVDQLSQEGRYREAIPIAQELLDVIQRKHATENHDTAVALSVLGTQLQMAGDYAKAKPLLQRALEIDLRVLGHDNAETGQNYRNLGNLFAITGEYAHALPPLQQSVQIFEKVLGPENTELADNLVLLANVYFSLGKYADAELRCQEALSVFLNDENGSGRKWLILRCWRAADLFLNRKNCSVTVRIFSLAFCSGLMARRSLLLTSSWSRADAQL